MMKLRISLLIITALSLVAGGVFLPEKKIDERAYLKEIAPDTRFSEKQGDPPHYKSQDNIAAFNSYDIVPSIRGYAGPIKLLLALNSNGEITGIRILEHKESESYVRYMLTPGYLKQFLGKKINDPFEAGSDIDAISRATVSVNALAATVRDSSREVASKVYGLEVKGGQGRERFNIGWILYSLLFLAALTFYYVTKRSKRLLKARDVTLLLGIALIGLYLAAPFSILSIFNLVLLRFSSSILWYVILISVIVSIFLSGRFYCGWLCPFGALAELIGRLPFKKWEISIESDDRWRNLKYLLLGVIIVIALTSGNVEYGNYETYVTLFSLHGNTLTWLLVTAMLTTNLRVERFWCRYLCPVAAFTGLFSRKDSAYKSMKGCPMANKDNPLISECIRCNKCYASK
jgi:Na+-translocating ferredoxin:NAD+ oxidoreductase RnfG subunit